MSGVFATDIGLQAQYLDSCVAEDVMLSLLKLGITCLPIHDSFIVTVSHYSILEKQMYESYQKVMGAPIAIKDEVIKSHRTLTTKNKDMASRPIDSDILSNEDLLNEYEYRQQGNLMQNYFKSYKDTFNDNNRCSSYKT